MVSQVTEWIGSDVAKKPSEGAVRKDPVVPFSWIKSQQIKDNEIQEDTEMFQCWKIICSEPNPAFQKTLAEPEFTLVHNSISKGFHLCFKGWLQNLCWNGLRSAVSGQMIPVTWLSVPVWSAENRDGKFKEFLLLFEYFGCYIQAHKHRRVTWKFFRLQFETISKTWVCITHEHSPDRSRVMRKWHHGTRPWWDI